MKTPLSTRLIALGLVATGLIAGTAIAGDKPRSDSPRGELRADTDGDGRVSCAERSAAWFDKLDLDKDGYVTQEEMRQARETRRSDFRAKADEHFKAADSNNDGQLSLDEVQAKMPKLADRFGTLDKDKNGFLSKSELQRPRHQPAT